MSQPIFHLLAGPNGAGKSTLYRALVVSGAIKGDLEFVNADLYDREHLQHIAGLRIQQEKYPADYILEYLATDDETLMKSMELAKDAINAELAAKP